MSTKNERSARIVTAIAPISLGKKSTRNAREKLEALNESVRGTLDEPMSKIFDGVLGALASSEAEYSWETFMGSVFSHPKWREEWAAEFLYVAALADLEPGEKLVIEPCAHDYLVESAKAAMDKVAAEFQAKILRFCHAITAAPKASEKEKDAPAPNGTAQVSS